MATSSSSYVAIAICICMLIEFASNHLFVKLLTLEMKTIAFAFNNDHR